jgi:D-arabinan exo alpha-(1,3)/(1,5)-arabinofuranosidase (non-reducing end)
MNPRLLFIKILVLSNLAVMAPKPAFAGQDLIEAGAFGIDTLPFLRKGVQTHQFCTYDRAGDNYDATYFPLYMETNGECVIFDAMGPGCLYRQQMNIWYGDPIYKGIQIRFYFDDEPKPRIDMDVSTFFSTNNPIFQPPLAFDGYDLQKNRDRFRIFYHPMFFKKRLKVVLSAEPGGPATVSEPWTGPADKFPDHGSGHWHWYQYTYQLFTEDPGLDSWTPETGRRLMPALIEAWNVRDEHVRAIQGCLKRTTFHKIEPGKTATIWKRGGAGAIAALHFQIAPTNNVDAVFDSWLKITFDGAATPQIEAPLGCFLGVYRNKLQVPYASLLLGWSNNQAYCYFPMPFWKSAVIEIQNRDKTKVNIAATVNYKTASSMPYPQQSCGYLFARYHREDPRVEGRDYTYLETSHCSGQVVGRVVGRWNTCCEENERTYFDGSQTPWIEGDGYEDDQGMGWGLSWGPPPLTLPTFGAPTGKVGSGGLYRFLLPDMYCFSSGIKSGHQTYGPHSPAGEEGHYHQTGMEESVTFWYGRLRPRMIQTDELDVGNLQSEAAHDYHAEGDVRHESGRWWYDGEFNNVLFKTPAIADDGVSFTNRSTFTVAISPDNQGVRLRRRCDKENDRQEARVFIDGRLVTERPWYGVDYERTFRGIRWLDSDFEVPAKYTKGKSKITVRIKFLSSETGRWNEYHYWIYSYSSPTAKRPRSGSDRQMSKTKN